MHIVNARHVYLKPRDAYQVNTVLENGGVAILPSDSGCTLVCGLGKKAVERVCCICTREKRPLSTLLCRNFSHIAYYTKVDNHQYRHIKTLFLCAFICILHTSREVSQWLQPEKCKNIALPIPDHSIMHKIRATFDDTLVGMYRALLPTCICATSIIYLKKLADRSILLLMNGTVHQQPFPTPRPCYPP